MNTNIASFTKRAVYTVALNAARPASIFTNPSTGSWNTTQLPPMKGENMGRDFAPAQERKICPRCGEKELHLHQYFYFIKHIRWHCGSCGWESESTFASGKPPDIPDNVPEE